ncbi:MAG TPA: hypothetical protein VFI42_08635, partial [Thermomicrobiaceae bacterium]|nr:hypothetical protein [Thermomicrobiaceae bacterium]
GPGVHLMTQDVSAPTKIVIEDCKLQQNKIGFQVERAGLRTGYIHGEIVVRNCDMTDNSEYAWYVEGDDVTLEHCNSGGSLTIERGNNINVIN